MGESWDRGDVSLIQLNVVTLADYSHIGDNQ